MVQACQAAAVPRSGGPITESSDREGASPVVVIHANDCLSGAS